MQWNADGLSQSKEAELIQSLKLQNIAVYTIMKANLTELSVKFYSISGYNLYFLPKYTRVASGLLVGVKKELVADLEKAFIPRIIDKIARNEGDLEKWVSKLLVVQFHF